MSKYFYNSNLSLLCVLPWFMRHTCLRSISDREKDNLYLLLDDSDSGYRATIILLKDEGYTVPEIRKMTNHHDNNIRKWIHRFNDRGIDGIISKKHDHSAQKITDDIERKIVHIASTNPRKHGIGFSTWSLRVLAGYLMEKKIVKSISHSEIRNVLLKYNVRWRYSKAMLGGSKDPEYDLKIKPTKSPELNLIEVRWMWLQRNAINNNTFKNEQDIGKVVSDWTKYYNHSHIKTITDTLHNELTCAFT